MEMTCKEFESSFDQYVDETLDAAMTNACSCHIAKCRSCDREVSRWQQTRILLSTAVADFSTAVDVSSVRSDVFAALGFTDEAAKVAHGSRIDELGRQSATREAAFDRGTAKRSAGRSGRRAASGERRSTFGAVLRFASAATVSAIAAAAAVMVISPAPVGTGTATQFASSVPPSDYIANNAVRPSGVGFRPASLVRAVKRERNRDLIAPVAYSNPPFAKPAVSHVEGLEAAPGQKVTTYVQRGGARVIWVDSSSGPGAPRRAD
jgi:anti-sigma factor RsiW